jgi:heterodisulfide reductase subunit C
MLVIIFILPAASAWQCKQSNPGAQAEAYLFAKQPVVSIVERRKVKPLEKVVPSRQLELLVMEEAGQPLNRCYQCHKCTGGCPLTGAMDLMPHQIVRYIQLGLEKDLLKSNTIWLCAACRTCISRCPNGIDIAAINDILKQRVIAKSIKPALPEVAVFHQTFLNSVKSKGRVHELGMMMIYKLKSRKFFQDIYPLGLKMLCRNKLSLLPEKVKNSKRFRALLEAEKEGQP